jgi:hypothetical protein
MDDLTRRPLKNTPHLSAPAARERQRGIDRVIDLLETLLHQRAPTRIGDIAHLINAPRSTTYEICSGAPTQMQIHFTAGAGRHSTSWLRKPVRRHSSAP